MNILEVSLKQLDQGIPLDDASLLHLDKELGKLEDLLLKFNYPKYRLMLDDVSSNRRVTLRYLQARNERP
jgi:hypothetical protein